MSSLFVIIFALCISIAVNANLTKSFLMCTGKEELFRCFPSQHFFMIFFLRFDVSDFYATPGPTGLEFKGPLWSPFRAMYNLTTWNMFISVPLFYRAIFKFRRGQELMPGDYRKWALHCMQPLCYITPTTRHLWDGEKKKKRKQLLHHTDHIHCLAPWGVPQNKSHIDHYFDFLAPGLAGHYL